MNKDDRLAWFEPKEDITLAELVDILKVSIFRMPGAESGAYGRMSPGAQRHFSLEEKPEP